MELIEEPLRSPLRYPGGKARVVKTFAQYVPEHTEYREIFVGGGSFFFYKPKARKNWLNDLHPGLYAFYVALRDRYSEFAALCREQRGDLRERFNYWANRRDLMIASGDEALVERAVQFFFLNRTVWSGRVIYDPARTSRLYFSHPDGWSNLDKRLANLKMIAEKLRGVKITCLPFERCLKGASAETFIYSDPPYMRDSLCSRTDRLYDGHFPVELHQLHAWLVSRSKAKIMISYDDCPEVRALYQAKPWRIVELKWRYCGRYAMPKDDKAKGIREQKVLGNELLIMNY